MTDEESWRLECKEARREDALRREAQERKWQINAPLEWAAWLRLQPLLLPSFGRPDYDFGEFLKDVGKAPSPISVIVRVDDSRPYQAGNLQWERREYAPSPDSPYLDAEQAAAYLKMSLSTFYKNTKYIPRMPGVGKLLYRREELDGFAAERRHRKIVWR